MTKKKETKRVEVIEIETTPRPYDPSDERDNAVKPSEDTK